MNMSYEFFICDRPFIWPLYTWLRPTAKLLTMLFPRAIATPKKPNPIAARLHIRISLSLPLAVLSVFCLSVFKNFNIKNRFKIKTKKFLFLFFYQLKTIELHVHKLEALLYKLHLLLNVGIGNLTTSAPLSANA